MRKHAIDVFVYAAMILVVGYWFTDCSEKLKVQYRKTHAVQEGREVDAGVSRVANGH